MINLSSITGSTARYVGTVLALVVIAGGLFGFDQYATRNLQAQAISCDNYEGGHCEWYDYDDQIFHLGSCGEDTQATCDAKGGDWYPVYCPAGQGGSCIQKDGIYTTYYGCGYDEQECYAEGSGTVWYPPAPTGGFCSNGYASPRLFCDSNTAQSTCVNNGGQWYTDLRTCQENTVVYSDAYWNATSGGVCPFGYQAVYTSPYISYANPAVKYPIFIDKDGQFVIRSTHCTTSYPNSTYISIYGNIPQFGYAGCYQQRECQFSLNDGPDTQNYVNHTMQFILHGEEVAATWQDWNENSNQVDVYTSGGTNSCYVYEYNTIQRTAFPGQIVACRKSINGVPYPGNPPSSSSSSSAVPSSSSSSSSSSIVSSSSSSKASSSSSSSSVATLYSCYTCSDFACDYDPKFGQCEPGQYTSFNACNQACASSSSSSSVSSSSSSSSSSSIASSVSSKSSSAGLVNCYTCNQGTCNVEQKVGSCGSNQYQTQEACNLLCKGGSSSSSKQSSSIAAVTSSSSSASYVRYLFVFGQFATPYCGDDVVQVNGANGIAGDADDEECDSKNRSLCTFRCKNPRCGDGILHPFGADGFQGTADDEQCDDGNKDNNDLCTNTCKIGRCGDGITQPNGQDGVAGTADDEQCDDGNSINGDLCSNSCTMPQCGDGIVQAGEQCDDGNTINTDACTNTCMRPRCGDGIVQPLGPDGWQGTADDEQCDDGANNVPLSLSNLSYGDSKRSDPAVINALTRSTCLAEKCKIAQCADKKSNEGIFYRLSSYYDELADQNDIGCRAGSCTNDRAKALASPYLPGINSELDPCNGGG